MSGVWLPDVNGVTIDKRLAGTFELVSVDLTRSDRNDRDRFGTPMIASRRGLLDVCDPGIVYSGTIGVFRFRNAAITRASNFRCALMSSRGVRAIHWFKDMSAQ